MINWKTRLTNKYFWLALGSAVVLVLQAFGMDISSVPVIGNYEEIVNAVFGVLVALGVAVNTSTPGIGD
jgi:phi LC3 family holin